MKNYVDPHDPQYHDGPWEREPAPNRLTDAQSAYGAAFIIFNSAEKGLKAAEVELNAARAEARALYAARRAAL